MKIENAEDLLDMYPKLKPSNRDGKLYNVNKDLFLINGKGRIERVTDGIVVSVVDKSKSFFLLEIKKTKLIDKGFVNV